MYRQRALSATRVRPQRRVTRSSMMVWPLYLVDGKRLFVNDYESKQESNMRANTSEILSFMFVAATGVLGGCVGNDAGSESQDVARVEMVPWSGTPRPEIAQALSEHPGGVQINKDQIAWNNGTVVLTIPSEPQPAAQDSKGPIALATVHGCPSGWFCFYQDINFNANTAGRRLQFSDCSSGGTAQFLTDYGFGNQTSSWVVNKSLGFVDVIDSETDSDLWFESGNSSSSWVGSAANDRADWFICFL